MIRIQSKVQVVFFVAGLAVSSAAFAQSVLVGDFGSNWNPRNNPRDAGAVVNDNAAISRDGEVADINPARIVENQIPIDPEGRIYLAIGQVSRDDRLGRISIVRGVGDRDENFSVRRDLHLIGNTDVAERPRDAALVAEGEIGRAVGIEARHRQRVLIAIVGASDLDDFPVGLNRDARRTRASKINDLAPIAEGWIKLPGTQQAAGFKLFDGEGAGGAQRVRGWFTHVRSQM